MQITTRAYCIYGVMEQERIIYETLIGARVCDTHWWRVKKVMSACELPLNKSGFELFLALKKTTPRHFTQYHKIKGLLSKQVEPALGDGVTGEQFLKVIEQLNITPNQSTVSRWFKAVGGFKSTQFYCKAALLPIVATALIYKSKIQDSQLSKIGA
ncbi:hypothetical protein [Trichormus sp. NMC-1]|uniref:hypothetical protein n=1 Tax=Trichormus sp. NMC-1 TaxID=1853259 RepID=UPI001F3E554C|nr:hypothetical protein [Trichormus sp. NMC-1]